MNAVKINVTVLGSTGRMGQAILAKIDADSRLYLTAGLDRNTDLSIAFKQAQVAIDFTKPEATSLHLQQAVNCKLPLVIGTTGLTTAQEDEISKAAEIIPIVYAANTSVGVTILEAMVEQVAAKLGVDYDIDILEMHHRHKVDAPSGTALMLGQAAAKGRGVDFSQVRGKVRDGHTGPRPQGEIGFAVLRGGDVAGDHTVYFAGEGERLELTYRASNRGVFAAGALRAAAWVVGQKPGLYTMRDVLGL